MNKLSLVRAITAAIAFICTPSQAALIDNGGGLFYDTVLDITWSQPDVERTWSEAETWVENLTLGGASDWRLPYISVTAGAGDPFFGDAVWCAFATELECRDNELGYMFYYNLGGTFGQPILTSGNSNLALFPTLRNDDYWSGTVYERNHNDGLDFVWIFFNGGFPDFGGQPEPSGFYTWAVHDGNVGESVIPVPATLWLFSSGLLGLIGIARRG